MALYHHFRCGFSTWDVCLFKFGLNPSVDFTGGTLLELSLDKELKVEDIKAVAIEQKLPLISIQKSRRNMYILRAKPTDDQIVTSVGLTLGETKKVKVEVVRNETIGPVLGKELLKKTMTATVFAAVMMLNLYRLCI